MLAKMVDISMYRGFCSMRRSLVKSSYISLFVLDWRNNVTALKL